MKLSQVQTLFNALGDPTRFRILHLLGEGELCVCDVMQVLKEPQSKVSRHLSYLRRSGLVKARRQGLWMHYRIAEPGAPVFRAVLEALRRSGSGCDELKKDLNEFRKNKSCLVACCQ